MTSFDSNNFHLQIHNLTYISSCSITTNFFSDEIKHLLMENNLHTITIMGKFTQYSTHTVTTNKNKSSQYQIHMVVMLYI